MIESFHFIRPLWLLTLLPLLVLLPLWLRQQRRASESQQVLAPHLLKFLGIDEFRGRKNPVWLAALCWLIASVAAAGPSWIQRQAPIFETERAQVILMDMNMATRAADIAPDRHTRLKFKAQDLIQGLSEGQTGLVAYAGDAFTISPLTRDPRNLSHMLAALSPEVMPIAGHDPLAGFREAHELLQQAGYIHADIFWLTGSIDRTQMEDIRSFLRRHNYRVSIIAAGTDEGAPVRTPQGELLRTPQGALIIPRLIPSYFEQISGDTSGHFTLIHPQDNDINALLNLGPLTTEAQEKERMLNHEEWVDAGPYFAMLLLPLLLIFARRQQLVSLVLPCLLAASLWSPPPVYASGQGNDNTPSTAPSSARANLAEAVGNFFRNTNQRALRAYQQGRYDRARETAQTAPMLQGMSAYRAEDFAAAANYFATEDTAEAHYNRGNSLAHAGELEQAIAAYDAALQGRPDWQQAMDNKQLVEDLLEQQQQESEHTDSGENQDGESEPGQEQESDQQQDTSDSENKESQQQDGDRDEQEQEQESEQEQQGEQDADTEQPQQPEDELDLEALQDAWDNLSDEEREQLEQLLRRVPDDPALLLRNRLRLEAQRRRGQRFN